MIKGALTGTFLGTMLAMAGTSPMAFGQEPKGTEPAPVQPVEPPAVPGPTPTLPGSAPTPGPAAVAPAAAPGPAAARIKAASGMPSGLPNFGGSFGAGINIGNLITGASAKLWASPNVAIQAALGEGSQGNNIRFRLGMTFCPNQWTSKDGQYVVPLCFGVGGSVAHDFASGSSPASTESGIALPVGLSVLVRDNPIELYFEVAPEFDVRSESGLRGRYAVYMDGSVGARYYF